MRRAARFFRQPAADRQLLVRAAILYVIVAVMVRVVRFGRARRLVQWAAAVAPARTEVSGGDARIAQAAATVASLMPGGNCLTAALAAQCLFAQYRRETTLRFGIAAGRPDARAFDAHAWLERQGATIVGARAIRYDPLCPSQIRCGSSPSSR